MSNSQNLINIISQKILNTPDKMISFADYMDLVLYHPESGYYGSGNVKIGSQGDFFTSGSLGSDFGELLTKQLLQFWQLLDSPQPFTFVEMGAGSGILAQDILNYIQKEYLEFFQALEYIIIEQSPSLISTQQHLLQSWSNKVSWKSWSNLAKNSITGCFFSNELVDAFPVHQIVIKEGNIQEVYVTIQDNQLHEIIAEPSTPEISQYFESLDIDLSNYPTGYRTEINLKVKDWLSNIARCLAKGYVITIDYGYSAEKYYHSQRNQGTLQCYYQHHRHDNAYVNLGEQDLTTHVNFNFLQQYDELRRLIAS